MFATILFLAGLIVFILKVFGVHAPIDLIALGLAFVTAGLLLGGWSVSGAPPWRRTQ